MLPKTLAHYEILSPLGAGGMREVYRARDTRLGREVALKILPPDVAHDPQRRMRFEHEARAVAALYHPHIVTVYSIEEAGGQRFLTMELVVGAPLPKRIRTTAWIPASPWIWPCSSPKRSPRCTTRASPTAISSPPTSWSHRRTR